MADEDWIAEGCHRGWVLLTKDRAIRYRAAEIGALTPGSSIVHLARQDLTVVDMVAAFGTARPAIERAVAHDGGGFWHLYREGSIKRMWPQT